MYWGVGSVRVPVESNGGQGTTCGSRLSLTCESQGWISAPQIWWPILLPTEPSQLLCFMLLACNYILSFCSFACLVLEVEIMVSGTINNWLTSLSLFLVRYFMFLNIPLWFIHNVLCFWGEGMWFERGVSCSIGWSWIHYVASVSLELLIVLPLLMSIILQACVLVPGKVFKWFWWFPTVLALS